MMQSENSPSLLYNLKKSVELWFRKTDSSSTTQVVEAITRILTNGLKTVGNGNKFKEFVNDLLWLDAFSTIFSTYLKDVNDQINFNNKTNANCSQILSLWILDKIRKSELCETLKCLLTDNELMDCHYMENAFLRDESYTNACLICISAMQLQKPSLLSLISKSLYIPVAESNLFKKGHRRSSSHPQFSVSPNLFKHRESENINLLITLEKHLKKDIKNEKPNRPIHFSTLRRCKSLPNLTGTFKYRPRSQTVSSPMPIPQREFKEFKNARSNDSTPKANFCIETQFNTQNVIEQKSHSDNFKSVEIIKDFQSPLRKGAIRKIITPDNNQSSKRSSVQKHKSIKHQNFDSTSPNSEDIKIHFDRDHEKSIPIELKKNDESISYSPISTSLKGLSPINFLSSISKNIFSPKSEPILIKSDRLNINSNTSSISSSFSKSLTTNNVFGSFVGTRDGEKMIKAHTNLFDDIMLPKSLQNSNENDINRSNTIVDSQNLASLLKTNLFSSNHTDLERENAHFKISEAVISVIEHIKWAKAEVEMIKNNSKTENISDFIKTDNYADNYTEKVDDKKIENKCNKNSEPIAIIETATSYLDTKEDSSAPSTAESANEDKDYDELLKSYDNILPEHVAYAEWGCGFDCLSAENVGLSLISKFNDTDLPQVSDLKWLISEEICTRYNVPQDLLPIPEINSSENPDDHVVHQIQRGTRDWAPPRKQVIFTEHPSITRKDQMQKQNYRCAGCGMRVAPIYSNRFRFCNYLGKYHCTGCHRNHKSIIPAKVLKKWDFGFYPVSLFSYRLLEEIWQYPLFQLSDIAPTLCERVRSLGVAKFRRTQLKYLKDFITSCRFSQNEEKLFYEIQTYVTADPDKWSMSDFVDAREGILQKNLKVIIDKCERHVACCVLCSARGFICELCLNDEPIYPWQLKVKRCDKCGICYHTKCFQKLGNGICNKCYRLTKKGNTDDLYKLSNL